MPPSQKNTPAGLTSARFFVALIDSIQNRMKIFTTAQVSELDRYTIVNEPIASIDLMERASGKLADWIVDHFDSSHPMAFFAGPGNNGGDALAVARMLALKNYRIDVFIPDAESRYSDCFLINLDRLKDHLNVSTINWWNDDDPFPEVGSYSLLVDGLFGTGLTRPLSGFPAQLVKYLNQSGIPILSIDIPSGLMGENNSSNDPGAIIRATYTLTFEFPKLSFLFKENEQFTGRWEVLPIGLHPDGKNQTITPWYFSDRQTMAEILKPRGKFSHKGTFGHALMVAGSYGKIGAAILAAKGCLRSGVGLLTVHLPKTGNQIIQTALPEAMVSLDETENMISQVKLSGAYQAVGIGPGIGKAPETVSAFRILLTNYHAPIVIDADGLNILSENPEMIQLIPANSILTPHPLEFERLAGKADSDYERLSLARRFAQTYNIILVLKGAYTAMALPDGSCWFNCTGNPGMGTAGSGDVLTGILTGLVAQGYSPNEAALLGVYLHGLSGDIALAGSSEEALLAGDIADHLGMAFSMLKSDLNFGKAKKKSHF